MLADSVGPAPVYIQNDVHQLNKEIFHQTGTNHLYLCLSLILLIHL